MKKSINGQVLRKKAFKVLAFFILAKAGTMGFCDKPIDKQEENSAVPSAVDPGDVVRKAKILNSPEWRRAVFELGHWLDSQQIYTPQQVANLKRSFNSRVKRMSSFDLQYLLDDLTAKLQLLDTPEARDARAWVGHYLSVASDINRSRILTELPDITRMSASELSAEITKLENKKRSLARQQEAFESSRRGIVSARQESLSATQQAIASSARTTAPSYSPFRGGSNSSETPFADVKTGGSVHVAAGPFGAYVSF